MAETNFHRLWKARVQEVLDARMGSIASGACSSYDHYKHEVGYRLGLLDALKLAEEVEREYD